MNRSIYYYLGVVVGIIVAVIAVSIVSLCKKKKGGCEFDERQELARTRASKYGVITLIGYLLIFGLLDDMGVFSAVRCIMDGESLTTVSWNIIVAVLLLFVMGTIGLKRLKGRHCDEAE